MKGETVQTERGDYVHNALDVVDSHLRPGILTLFVNSEC